MSSSQALWISQTPFFVNNEFGSRRISVRMISGGERPGVFYIPGFGTHGRGERAEAFIDECMDSGRNLVILTPSGVDKIRFDPGTQKYIAENVDLARWANDAEVVLDKFCKGQQIVVTSSLNSFIGPMLAKSHSDRVKGLILLAPADIEKLTDPLLQTKQSSFDFLLAPFPGDDRECHLRVTRGEILDGRKFITAISKEQTQLPCSVVIVHDPKDPTIRIESSRELLGRIQCPEKRLVEAPNSTHTQARGTVLDNTVVWQQVGELLRLSGPA
jgi:pimeloyl-ACP methyl ester carboxylesterase